MSTWADNSTTGRTAIDFESLTSPGIRVAEFHPAGDGVTDDYIDLQAAITTSYTSGLLVLDPLKTYYTSTRLVIASPLVVIGNGATIKKSAALNNYALLVSGNGVEIRDLNINGNSGLSGCLSWTGAGGVARRVTTTTTQFGFVVSGTGSQLDCFDCSATFHTTYGFSVDGGGRMRLYNYRADNCGSGVVFGTNAVAGCHFDGTSNNSLTLSGGGVKIFAPAGTCGRYVGNNNRGYGIYAFGSAVCKDWTFAYVEDNDTGAGLGGLYSPNTAATGVELFGVSGFQMPVVVVRRALGYGVALTRDTGTSVGCVNCTVVADCTGCLDPAFHISGGSTKNVVRGVARFSTLALSFGEGVPGQSNYNTVDIDAVECTFAVLNLNQASGNLITIRAKDCITSAPYTSLIRVGVIGGGGAVGICTDNTIHWSSSNPSSADPAHIMICDVSVNPATNKTTGNQLVTAFTPDYATAVLSDPNGLNNAWLASKTAL